MFEAGTSRGTGQNKVGTTLLVSPTANIEAGRLVVVYATTDNVATTDGDTTGHAITDTDGHTWTRLKERTESSGVAADGITGSIWIVKLTSQLATTDSVTLTVTGGGTDPAKAMRIVEFPVTENQTFQVVGTAQSSQGNGADPGDLVVSGLADVDRLFLACGCVESSSTACNNDTDYTDLGDIVSSGGGSASNVRVRSFYDIKSGTSSDTFDPTLSGTADFVMLLAAVDSVVEGGNPDYGLVLRAEDAVATDDTTMTTKSVSIEGDGAVLSVFSGVSAGTANTPTVSGWTEIGVAGAARKLTTFKRSGTFTGAVSIDFGGQTQTFRGYCISDAFGYDITNLEVQEDSVVHESSLVTTTSGNPLALASFAEADNTVYIALLHGGASPNPNTFDAGMFELQDRAIGGESVQCAAAWNDAEDTQPDASWTNAGHYVTHAFEFAQAAAGQTVDVAQALETDLAQAVAHSKALNTGQSNETDAAQATTALRSRSIGQALEVDTAQAVTSRHDVPVGQATEVDEAGAVTAIGTLAVGQASETDEAQAIVLPRTRLLAQTSETDQALIVTPLLPQVVPVGIAPETDVAHPMTAVVGDVGTGIVRSPTRVRMIYATHNEVT